MHQQLLGKNNFFFRLKDKRLLQSYEQPVLDLLHEGSGQPRLYQERPQVHQVNNIEYGGQPASNLFQSLYQQTCSLHPRRIPSSDLFSQKV